MLSSIRVQRTVIATGGSAVYRPQAMAHLATLGPVVFLDVPLETIEERIARNPDRGLAIAPGQTLADIFYEREALYTHYATLRCDARQKTPQQCARWIAEHLPPLPGLPTLRMTGLRLFGRGLFLWPLPCPGCRPLSFARSPKAQQAATTFPLDIFPDACFRCTIGQ